MIKSQECDLRHRMQGANGLVSAKMDSRDSAVEVHSDQQKDFDMKVRAYDLSTATTLKLFVVGAVVVLALLCSLAVFGLQQDRNSREQMRLRQCTYLEGAMQTAQARIETPNESSNQKTSETDYLAYLKQELVMQSCVF